MKSRLFVGYKASDIHPEILTEGAVFHTLDIYHCHAIEKVFPSARVICSAHLPAGPWDEIHFKTGPKLMSGELSLNLLQEIAQLVGGDLHSPRFQLDFTGRERERNDLLNKISDDPKRVRNFRAKWQASVPGGEPLNFISYPGCFCHRRLDEGGLALAEVVTREVLNDELRITNDGGISLLDMGCGCGLVGLLVANRLAVDSTIRRFDDSTISLTLIDSNTRAIEAARENAANLGIAAKVILSDDGTPAESNGTFDVFVGNPPYYSDYRIADVFLETAQRALKTGGVAYTVCKNAAGLEPVQRRYFPQVEIIHRRGYAVLKSVKE